MKRTKYKTLTLHEFKANLCHYLYLLKTGQERQFTIRRYKKEVAMIVGLNTLRLNREAEAALAGLRAHLAAHDAHKAQRAHIRARALTHWPEDRFYWLRRRESDIIFRYKKR
jgi:hypothetical protein